MQNEFNGLAFECGSAGGAGGGRCIELGDQVVQSFGLVSVRTYVLVGQFSSETVCFGVSGPTTIMVMPRHSAGTICCVPASGKFCIAIYYET